MSTAAEPDDATVPDWKRDYSGLPPDHPSRHRQRHQPQEVQEAQYREVIRRSGTLPLLEQTLHGHCGRQSRLGIEGALVAALAATAEHRTYKRSDINASVNGITDETAAEIRIADRSERPISYSTVERLLLKFEEALVDYSRHPVHGEYGWLDEDGMYMLAYWWSDEMINASILPEWRAVLTSIATDGTPWPTWWCQQDFTRKKDIIAKHAQRRAEELGLEEPDLSDRANPCGSRPGELGPDGRPIPTLCPTARWGHRTKTPKKKEDQNLGHDVIASVTVRDFHYQGNPEESRLGDDVPQLLTCARLIPTSANPAAPSAALARNFKRNFPNARDVVTDRGISNKPSFVHACHAEILNVTMDYTSTEVEHPKTVAFGRNNNMYYQHVGVLLPGWLDSTIVKPPRIGAVDPTTGETVTEGDEIAWHVERAKLRCTINNRLANGDYQYKTPLAAGRIGTEHTMHTANEEATEYPSDVVYLERYFKVPIDKAGRLQRTPWHSPAWYEDYGRRSIIETGNSRLKDEGGLADHSCRVRSFVAHIITVTLLIVILNLEEVRRFELKKLKDQEKADKKRTASKNSLRDTQPNSTAPDRVNTAETAKPDHSTESASTRPQNHQATEANEATANRQTQAPASHSRTRRNKHRKQPAQ